MGKLPWGLIGMVALVAAGERFVGAHRLDFTRPEGWEWRLNAQAAERKVVNSNVLAIGSSLVKLGIVPQAIEHVLGRPVYNLGMCASPAPANYFVLRRALESGAKPSVVVVEFQPHTLMKNHWHTEGYWPDFLNARECLELSWNARDARFFATIMLARLLPSLKDRHEIRKRTIEALQGKKDPHIGLVAMVRTLKMNQGAKIVPKSKEGPAAALPAEDLECVPNSWACDPLNEAYTRAFFELADLRGIQVVWLIPPARSDLQELRERNGLDRDYNAFARRMQSRYPGVTIVDATQSGYPAEMFIDGMHLDRDGALALSLELAEVLSQKHQWVHLPKTRAQPRGLAVEDLGQSVEAILKMSDSGRGRLLR